jgi:copper transport protein
VAPPVPQRCRPAPAHRLRRRGRARPRRALAAAVAGLIALIGLAAAVATGPAPAGAHAVVVASSPAAGQVVARSPSEVWVQFDESVRGDVLTVLDSSGQRVDEDDAELTAQGDTLLATLRPDLPDGTYVLNYRVVSGDGHPVAGSIVFGVGEGTELDPASVAGLEEGTRAGAEHGGSLVRFVTYVGALLAAGLAVFLAFVHDGGPERRPLAGLARVAVVVGAIGAVATVAVQAAVVSGRGASAVTDPDLLRQALGDGLGWSTAVLVAGLALVHVAVDVRRPLAGQALTFYGALAVAASFVFWGHASTAEPRWLALLADGLHVAAALVWLGGLVGVAVVLTGRLRAVGGAGGDEPPVATVTATSQIVRRFSDLAAVSATLLVVAGVALATTEVGAWSELWTTTYGRYLSLKAAIVLVVLLSAAAYNRWRLVPEVEADATLVAARQRVADGEEGAQLEALAAAADGVEPAATWRRLARVVRVEVVAVVVVLAITGVLTGTTPPGTEQVATGATNLSAPLPAGGQVTVSVTPSGVGTNSVHLQYSDDVGRPINTIREVALELRQPSTGIGPITTAPPPEIGPGHFIANDLQIPSPGTWELTVVTRLSEFDQERATFPLQID